MARTQFTLIERPEYHPTAVSGAVLADMLASGEPITIQRPITKAEIKRDRVHVQSDEHYFEMKAYEAWRALAHGKTFKATVVWFNRLKGQGYIEIPELTRKRVPIYACNIAGKKTWYPETACVYYVEGQEIDVRIDVHPGQTFAIGLTPGTLDAEAWDRIKDKSLAFRCDESGKAVTGLFA